MATGANRGAWYAGLMGPLAEAGIEFELLAGVSAGGIASAWFAARDEEAYIDSWRQADPYRIALHPALSYGRRRTVDHLISNITLSTAGAFGHVPANPVPPYIWDILPVGETGWFSVWVPVPTDVEIGEVVISARGWETDTEMDSSSLTMVDEWAIEETPFGVTLTAIVENTSPNDLVGLNATVATDSGCRIWAYASVIENSTGDPTTVVVEPAVEINLNPRGAGPSRIIPWDGQLGSFPAP